jgi:hypothetical protein
MKFDITAMVSWRGRIQPPATRAAIARLHERCNGIGSAARISATRCPKPRYRYCAFERAGAFCATATTISAAFALGTARPIAMTWSSLLKAAS